MVFKGQYLDVAKHPKFAVYIGGDTYYSNVSLIISSLLSCHCNVVIIMQRCSTRDGVSLLCYSPRLPNLLDLTNRNKRSRDGGGVLLNYTVVIDAAPGPNISDESLVVTLRPDPVFIGIAEGSQQYQVFSGESITITVSVEF